MTTSGVKEILANTFAGEANQPGKIAFANDVAVSAPAVTWLGDATIGLVENNGLVEARKFIAPDWKSFYSNTEASYPFFERKENFHKMGYDQLKRAVGGVFKEIATVRGRKAVELENIGLTIALEKNQANNDPGYKARNAQTLVNVIETATLIQALNILDGTVGENIVQWDPTGDSNPDALLRERMRVAGDAAGDDVTNVWYGRRAWLLRREWFDAHYTAGAFMAARTVGDLGDDINATVKIPYARANDGTSLKFPNIGRNSIYGFFAMSGSADISNVKTIIGKDGDLKVTEWEHPQGEMLMLTVSRWQAVVATSDLGAFRIDVPAEA
ncbi:MAG: hypothetical protein LUD72_09810 [Bacteroidales bacterium]|nr:hypothetical protein [Bacteroidales bacterium]